MNGDDTFIHFIWAVAFTVVVVAIVIGVATDRLEAVSPLAVIESSDE